MVIVSAIRNVAKRIPTIKFRKGGLKEHNNAIGSQSIAAAPASASGKRHASSGPAIEDWQLPNRYRRRQIDEAEINAINSGGAF